MSMNQEVNLGAAYLGNGQCMFRVWAPFAESLDVHVVSPVERIIALKKDVHGYYSATVQGIKPGALYLLRMNGEREFADPASQFQPQGVHGPSQVVDHRFEWTDGEWSGIPLRRHIIYELHVGTFTREGTFDAIIPRLSELKDLGVNNIEIMPVSQFPGNRNWGYDGVLPFAVQNTYGGPKAFKRLINACHREGLAVSLDVVYNHFGPEGNYLREFGPYFTGKYKTPWGDALNFDDAFSDEVRNFFIQNAIYWFALYHIDALRLDAVHAIYDLSATPFLEQLSKRIEEFSKESGRKRYLIAESDLNDSRLIRPCKDWGYGLDAQWSDDFHHSLHALLTGENLGYYSDFGKLEHLVKSIKEGYFYSGCYSNFRKRSHGNFSADRPGEQFVVALQNHDQVGNRMLGERISSLVSFDAQKLAAGILLLSPYVPLIFMGQEYGEEAPFLYFVSHTDQDLISAIRKGRKEEFKDFIWKEEPPDPEGEETFERSKLNWENRNEGKKRILLNFYKTLIRLRREIPAFSNLDKNNLDIRSFDEKRLMVMKRWTDGCETLCLFNLNSEEIALGAAEIQLKAVWKKILDSSDETLGGPGFFLAESIGPGESLRMRPQSFAVFVRE